VLGCAAEFYLYQAFGIYVMLEMEIFQNGGYNADDMGLGKTIEMLGVIALNRVLLKNHYEVQDARCREAWTMHLPKGTKENPQSSTAKCPSHNRYGIECPCVDDSPSARLRPTAGANLIVVPAALIAGWVKQTSIILRNDVLLGSWNIRQGYTHGRLDHLAPHLRIEDRPLLECTNDVFRDSACHADASTVVVITTKKCYNQHVVNLFTRVITLSKGKPRGKTLTRREVMKFAWGRACIDEAHQNQTATNGAVLIFKSIGSHVRKWFLTGTPFESSPDQMAYWVQTLQLGWDKHLITPANSWPRLDLYRRQLRECTFEKIKDLGKTHKRLIRFQSMDNTELNVYIEKLSTVLNTLWLRRTSDQSRFFDQPLTDVLPNIHQEIICRLPAKYVDIVNSDTGTITVALQQQLARQQAEADAKRKSGRVFVPEPEININNWLMKARRMRILSTFPRLGTLPATRSLSFTGDEDTKNGWVTLVDKKTYELKVTNSPYELHIEDICSAENCSKVKAINILITRTWDEGEKAIFTTMGPTNALILYWYLRIVHKARVALIHGKMDKSRVQKIVWLFQEDDTNDTTLEESPQYLVGTTKLIGVGFTMTKARRLVQLDPEWMSRDEQQARKRINRITQKGQTYTYALYSEGSQVEQMIHDRQNRRAHMMNLALDPNLTNVSKVTRGIGDDEDDNSDEEAEGMDNSNLRPEI
jgi:SNF2 family DNA or RNA helicase